MSKFRIILMILVLPVTRSDDSELWSSFLGDYVQNPVSKFLTFLKFKGNSREENQKVEKLFYATTKTGTPSRILTLGGNGDDVTNPNHNLSISSLISAEKFPSSDFVAFVETKVAHCNITKITLAKEFRKTILLLFSMTSHFREDLRAYALPPLYNKVKAIELVSNNPKVLKVWEAYRPSEELPVQYNYIGKWNGSEDPTHRLASIEPMRTEPWSRRNNLLGLKIKCSVVPFYHWNILTNNSDGITEDSGVMGKLLNIIVESLNATVEIHVPADLKWGGEDDNGEWSGVIGELVKEKADISSSQLDMTYQRSRAVEFLPLFIISRHNLIIKTPELHGSVYIAYIKIFSPMTWVVVGIYLIVTSASLCISVVHEPNQRRISFSESLFIAVGALFNEAHTFNVKSFHGYLITLVMFTTGLLLNIYYNSSLISTLTVYSPTLPFEDIFGLYNAREDFSLRFVLGSSIESYFKESPRKIIKDVRRDMLQDFMASNESLSATWRALKSIKENEVFIHGKTNFLINFFSCSYVILPEEVFGYPTAWAIRKNSSLIPIINYRMKKLLEAGVLRRLRKSIPSPSPESCRNSSVGPLSLFRLISLFLLVGVGVILSVTILAVEIMKSHRRGRDSSKESTKGKVLFPSKMF